MMPKQLLKSLEKQLSLVVDEEGNVLLDGSMVEDATKEVGAVSNDSAAQPYVSLKFNDEGTAAFAEATKNNLNKQIYIVMDDEVISAPMVNSVISDGNAMITGSFTVSRHKSWQT